MKIIYENGKENKVYIQKRDILYLERLGECQYPLCFAKSPSQVPLQDLTDSDFVLYEGEEALHYFKAQKNIIDYLDYLEMSSEDLTSYLEDPIDSYSYQSMQELHFEKEGIKALPYPITPENSKCLLSMEEEHVHFSFNMSLEIPQLFSFVQTGESCFLHQKGIPWSFVTNCKKLASVYTFKEDFIILPTNDAYTMLLMPLPEEKKKQEEIPKKRSYIKQFLHALKKTEN